MEWRRGKIGVFTGCPTGADHRTVEGVIEMHAADAAQPKCPKCDVLMTKAERTIRRITSGLRVGSPHPPARVIRVWRCAACGIDVARFES